MSSSSATEHPFTDAMADIIFCSSDNVHFRLHKVILSLASDFFRDMFSLPQPSLPPSHAPTNMESSNPGTGTSVVEGLPVVPVTESSGVLESLFRLSYPIKDPPLQTLEQVRPTLEAALKYQMPEAIDITTERLLNLVETAPLRVYAIACRLSLYKVVTVAARAVRERKLQDTYVEELEGISVAAYHQLLAFCEPPSLGIFGFGNSALQTDLTILPHTLGAPAWSYGYLQPIKGDCIPSVFNLENADVVIQTSDNVRLGATKSIMRLSSEIFDGMLRETPSAPTESGLQVLSVPEHSGVLIPLLELCYPLPQPSFDNIRVIPTLMVTARKYKMRAALQALERALRYLVETPPRSSIRSDPLSAYFACCRLGMRDLAARAAARTLRMNIAKERVGGAESFGVSAGHLWRLLEYHRRCRAAVRAVVTEDARWVSEDWKKKLKGCRGPNCPGEMPCWWAHYLAAIAREAWPSSASARSELALRAGIAPQSLFLPKGCDYCHRPDGLLLLFSVSQYVASTMDEREREVTLPDGQIPPMRPPPSQRGRDHDNVPSSHAISTSIFWKFMPLPHVSVS